MVLESVSLTHPRAVIQVCYLCLARVQHGTVDKAGHMFCSQDCAATAWETFLQAETAVNTIAFTEYCLQTRDTLPLLAARHLFSRLQNPVRCAGRDQVEGDKCRRGRTATPGGHGKGGGGGGAKLGLAWRGRTGGTPEDSEKERTDGGGVFACPPTHPPAVAGARGGRGLS